MSFVEMEYMKINTVPVKCLDPPFPFLNILIHDKPMKYNMKQFTYGDL